jgi:hypothetical protein
MSFKPFDSEDVIVSADSISSTVWSTGAYEMSTFFTSSTQEAATSGDYYLNVFQTSSGVPDASVQYSIAYGEKNGNGSTVYNSAVAGKSPSSTIYGQYRSLVLGDEDKDFNFGGQTEGDKGIWIVSVDRARYKEKFLPGTFNIILNDGSTELALTDNSTLTSTVTYNDAGRVYDIISGSNGTSHDGGTGYSSAGGYIASYGKFLPDVGLLIFNAKAVISNLTVVGSQPQTGSAVVNGTNNTIMHNLIANGNSFKLNSEETISSNYVFVRVRNGEFNYSNNPSNITGSGELRHNAMVNNPQAYITSVGLYNDNNDLLGVAKLSRPLLKDFTKEALIRIKLDY